MKGSRVLDEILSGNRRFVTGERTGLCNPVDVDLGGMVHSQSPMAAVLCCSDSRVPPDHVLDRKIGEIFVVRVAGKVPGPAVIGSLEYAVEHLKVPLLLVLGHEGCGAVKAAVQAAGGTAEGALADLIREIEPAVRPIVDQAGEDEDVMEEAVEATVRHSMIKLLERSSSIKKAVDEGRLMLKGAVYSLGTGEVKILDEEE